MRVIDLSNPSKVLEDLKRDIEVKKTIMKLPCGHGSIRIKDKAEDQYIVCPKCMKKFLLVWQGKKIWTQ